MLSRGKLLVNLVSTLHQNGEPSLIPISKRQCKEPQENSILNLESRKPVATQQSDAPLDNLILDLPTCYSLDETVVSIQQSNATQVDNLILDLPTCSSLEETVVSIQQSNTTQVDNLILDLPTCSSLEEAVVSIQQSNAPLVDNVILDLPSCSLVEETVVSAQQSNAPLADLILDLPSFSLVEETVVSAQQSNAPLGDLVLDLTSSSLVEETVAITSKSKYHPAVIYKEWSDSDSPGPLFSDSNSGDCYNPSDDSSDEDSSNYDGHESIFKKMKLQQKEIRKRRKKRRKTCITQEEPIIQSDVHRQTNEANNKEAVNKEVVDINYHENEAGLPEQENGQIIKKRKRNRKGLSTPHLWARQINKEKRMRGEEYQGLKKENNGKYTLSIKRGKREIKNRCNCKHSNTNNNSVSCTSFQEDDRKENFKYAWTVLDDWSGRKAYITSLIEKQQIVKRRKTTEFAETTKRNVTYKYHLIRYNTRVHVCKTMFLNTFGLGEKTVMSWLHKMSPEGSDVPTLNHDLPIDDTTASLNTPPSARPKRKKSLVDDEKTNSVNKFFESLPKMESHYCRASSNKLYLEPTWPSKIGLFKEYRERFCSDDKPKASYSVFSRVMYKLNIDLYQPKKDQCETCLKHKLGSISDEEFLHHKNRKLRAREEKQKDKERVIGDDSLGMYTVDVQAVLLLPNIMSSSAYYKTKLKLHNYTIYDMKSADVNCFLWHEANGQLDSDVFASILYKFLMKEIREKHLSEITIWSDGCTYQNRCEKVSNALLHLSNTTNVTIVQKYLEVGHTQMEVDSVHSKIEKKIKGKEFYVPFDYVRAIREARTHPTPFNVTSLKYTDFFDFSDGYYTSIRPGSKKGDPYVTGVCAFRYFERSLYYKLDHENEWEKVPRRPKTSGVYNNLRPLYKFPINIKLRKFQDLQSLKRVIHEDFHNFYNTLPHDCDDSLQATGQCKHVIV